ncbi:MAG: hypothetical protein ABGW56_02760 [Flavobacteriaceae bacterium]|jgi:hypothetical protein
MAKLTLQEVSSILGKSATKLNPATAIAGGSIKAGKAVSKEMFGYDFVGLLMKIVVFFAVSYLAEIFIRGKIAVEEVLTGTIEKVEAGKIVGEGGVFLGSSSIAGMVFSYLYKSTTGQEYNWIDTTPLDTSTDNNKSNSKSGLSNFWSNEKIKQLFSEQGFHGLNYWSVIKIIVILLVIAEFSQYLKMNKNLGGKSSSFTIAIFTLIIVVLGLTTVPELVKRIKTTDFNLEALR